MATIHKLTKDGATIFPATITDAVVHQDTGKTLTSMIKEYNVSELFPTEGIAGGNTYNLALAVQVLGTHLRASEKTGGIKLTFISSLSGFSEEYYLNKGTWSGTVSDWKQRFEVGDVVNDPSGSWEPGTAEQYIDQQVAEINSYLAGETVARQTGDTNLQNQVDTLSAAVGTGGTVDQRIQAEATTRANADTALSNRITPLEQAVGTGGSIDTRIANAKSEIIGNATSSCDTLGEAEAKINANTTAISNEANTRSTADEQLRQLYENLTQSDVIVGPRPSSGQLTNVIYREPDQSHTPPQNYSDYMWYNNDWVLMATYDNAIDDEPTAGSDNLVKSGGIVNMYGKYVENPEFAYVITDSEKRVLFGINKNGGVKLEFTEELPKSIQEALLTKVDKITGKNLIDSIYSDSISSSEDVEFLKVEIDPDGRLLSSTNKDGSHYISYVKSETIDEIKETVYDETSIFHHNPDSLYRNLFIQANRKASVGTTYYEKPLVLVHFSDIHGYVDNLSRLVSFCSKYGIYIDDILHTGDSVFNTWNSGFDFWNAVDGTDKILNCIGNHDVSYDGGSISPDITPLMAYNRYFRPYINNWNVNSAGEGLCYYYKDYIEENIRLIVLDNCKWDNSELTWFENTLSSAGNLNVICAGHFPCGSLSSLDCTFETLNVKVNVAGMPSAAMDAVQSFINNDGTFICWLVGHAHLDYMGTLTDYPQQFMVAVANAGLNDVWDDTSRVEGTKSQDSFNVLSFDTHDKLIKGFKVGADYDRFLRHRGTFCYNYDTMQLIYNN